MRLLEKLPNDIDSLEKQIKVIEDQLSKPDLYNQDNKKFKQLSQELEQAKFDLEQKLEQWLEVEIMQEKINK